MILSSICLSDMGFGYRWIIEKGSCSVEGVTYGFVCFKVEGEQASLPRKGVREKVIVIS